jgi:hypothetical protein
LKCPGQTLTAILAISGLIISPSQHAAGNYCENSKTRNFIRVTAGRFNQAQLDKATLAQVDITTNEINITRVLDQDQQHPKSIGFNFRYTTVDLQPIDAMTNGHLHTWDFPFEGRLNNTDSEWLYSITPAISVSSNALKNPELIGIDGLQFYTGMVYKKDVSNDSAWILGFRSDHRFGTYKAYPVVGICMLLANGWDLQLALPDFSITKRFDNKFNLKLFAEPVGNQWHVLSKDKARESDFTYNAIATGLSAVWRISESINVHLAIENQTNRRFRFTLDDNTFIETKAESSRGLSISGELLF